MMCGKGACMAGECAWWREGMHGRGSMHGGGMWQGGMCGRGAYMAGETANAADGTHPTGMLSCL